MASQALQTLIAAKRANPYTAEKTLAELRAEADARAAAPLPDGVTHVAVYQWESGKRVPQGGMAHRYLEFLRWAAEGAP